MAKALVSSLLRPSFLYLTGIIFIAVGLSLSKPLISIGQGILGLAWILEGNHKEKIIAFFKNSIAWALISYYVLTILGLLYTSDFDFAWDDIRRKMPLFVIPFVLFSKTFSSKELKLIFSIYVGGVLLSSFWSMFVKLGGLGIEITDVRDLSRFNSHIRFGLEICLAIFLGFFYINKSTSLKEKIVWAIIILWLIIFMVLISLMTGFIIFMISIFLLFILNLNRISSSFIKFSSIICLFLITCLSCYKIYSQYHLFFQEVENLPLKDFTPNGSRYFHSLERPGKENGFYVWRNLSQKELEAAWEKRSNIPFRGKDQKGQPLSTTLTRFISSKGDYKDQIAVEKLTNTEIKAIENGIANVRFLEISSIDKRLYDLFWELENYYSGGDYNGHSLIMRLEYWKTGLDIFKKNWLLGVGTGDIQLAYDKQYQENNSLLKPQFLLRAHNQYITAMATFGTIGLIIFLFFIAYPVIQTKAHQSFIYLGFFIVVIISMITEDTLDTQVGISFFVFFNTLLLYHKKELT